MRAPVARGGANLKPIDKAILPRPALFLASETVQAFSNPYVAASLRLEGIARTLSTFEYFRVLSGMSSQDVLKRVFNFALTFANTYEDGQLLVLYTLSPRPWRLDFIFERAAREVGIQDLVTWKAVASHDNAAYPALYDRLTE